MIVLSHLGRPKGKKNLEFTQKPVAEALSRALGKPVAFAPDCIGPQAKQVVDKLRGRIRHARERPLLRRGEKNDREFAKKLAEPGDVLVSDAFSCSHRAHASVEALARLLPSAAGRLMQAEIEALTAALEAPKHGGGDDRRCQDLHQARSPGKPGEKGRSAGHRRRHGQYLPRGPGCGNRRLAGRARHGGNGAADPGDRERRALRDRAADGCRGCGGLEAEPAAKTLSVSRSAKRTILDIGPADSKGDQ